MLKGLSFKGRIDTLILPFLFYRPLLLVRSYTVFD